MLSAFGVEHPSEVAKRDQSPRRKPTRVEVSKIGMPKMPTMSNPKPKPPTFERIGRTAGKNTFKMGNKIDPRKGRVEGSFRNKVGSQLRTGGQWATNNPSTAGKAVVGGAAGVGTVGTGGFMMNRNRQQNQQRPY